MTTPAPMIRDITQERINAYAEASGDSNPLHLDPAFAAATEFGSTIAHGMMLLGYMSDSMTRAYGEAWATTGRFRARFRAPARPGDTVTISRTERSRESGPDGEILIRCVVECRNGEGQTVATGDAQLTLAGS